MIGPRIVRGCWRGRSLRSFPTSERGGIAPLAVIATFVLFGILSFSVDQGVAYAFKARQENALDSARASCMDASFLFAAKNADNPGRLVAERIVEAVRLQGFDGRATVWFYEAPEGEVPRTERLWLVGMQVEEDVPTVLAHGLGIETIPAASYRVMELVPYSSETHWRPAGSSSGRYEYGTGATGLATYTRIDDLSGFPKELADMADASMAAEPKGDGGR